MPCDLYTIDITWYRSTFCMFSRSRLALSAFTIDCLPSLHAGPVQISQPHEHVKSTLMRSLQTSKLLAT